MNRKKILIVLGILLVVGIIIVANLVVNRKKGVKVETQQVVERELRAIVSASGKIRAKISVDVSASTTGKVVKLAVDEGDTVRKGQFLLQIDPTPAKAAVQQLQASIAAAKANLKLAKANLEQAKIEYERQKALFEKNLTSQDLMQKAKTQYNVQRLQVEATRQEIERLRAMLNNAKHELAKVNVHADVSGIVIKRNIEEGENVFVGAFNNPATVLLTIADLSVIEAEVEVDETDIVDVQVGQQADIKVDAYPDTSFKGVVTQVGHSPIVSVTGITQQQATSFQVIIQLTDRIPNVRPGLSCKAEITTGYREKAVAVPIQALTVRRPSELKPIGTSKGKKAVKNTDATDSKGKEKEIQGAFVVKDGKVEFHEVKIGISGERYFEVLSGLKPGDEVVTGPFSALRRLRNGDAVIIENRKKTGK
ncbi:MAG: efflux RND transporter periplasmic adaptor subunit [candidate division KSB1 bacterium]|nr:efflux RND transporter periplasmic adaptor subunit [candidate division KSB1 bacterium]